MELEEHLRNGMDTTFYKSVGPSGHALPFANHRRTPSQSEQESQRTPVTAAMFNNRYQFCGVLGKKMKRMGAMLNERSKVAN